MTICDHDISENYFVVKRFKKNKLKEDEKLCHNCFEFSAFCTVEQIKRLMPEKYKQFKEDAIKIINNYSEGASS